MSWPRVLPDGVGRINGAGLDFYGKIIDNCLENGIEPFLTLYHWDLPSKLQEKGGFESEDFPKWFSEYTDVITKKFGDRVKNFITFNEPQSFIGMGYQFGNHAPGVKQPYEKTFNIQRNVLLSHGDSVEIIRKNVKNSVVGISAYGETFFPVDGSKESLELARRKTFLNDGIAKCSWLLDPIVLGKYANGSPEYNEYFAKYERELKRISAPIDYIGYNIYGSTPVAVENKKEVIGKYYSGYPESTIGTPMNEKSIYYMLKFVYDRYRIPLMITENGFSEHDWVCMDNKVHDSYRIDYMKRHIGATLKAKDEGVDVRGYFVWSLMDNFEWAFAYSKRFGLFYVDFETEERIIKDSGYFYRDFIKEQTKN